MGCKYARSNQGVHCPVCGSRMCTVKDNHPLGNKNHWTAKVSNRVQNIIFRKTEKDTMPSLTREEILEEVEMRR